MKKYVPPYSVPEDEVETYKEKIFFNVKYLQWQIILSFEIGICVRYLARAIILSFLLASASDLRPIISPIQKRPRAVPL